MKESVRSFIRNQNLANAATMAYYGSLSLMPLLLLVIFVLSLVMQSSEEVLTGMERVTSQLFPVSGDVILKDLLTLSQQKVWGIVSIVILLWSVTPFAGAMRRTVYMIFRSGRKIHFFKAKLLDVAAIVGVLLLFVLLASGKVLQSLVSLKNLPDLSLFDGIGRWLVTFLVTLGVIAFFFTVFTPVRLKRRNLWVGSLVTVFLLSAIKPLFGLILRFNPDYGYAFGSMKTIFLIIVWVYYTCAVMLYGAELMAAIRRHEALLLRGLFLEKGNDRAAAHRLLGRFVFEYARGDTIFKQGDPGDCMYYMLEGEISIQRHGQELAVMCHGDYFGEMSMLLGSPRAADAKVISETVEVVVISQDNFDAILREDVRIVKGMLKKMAARLVAADELLESKV